MRVLFKEPGKDPRSLEIPNKLVPMQILVGGHIETVRINDNVVMICNEEGKLLCMEPNFFLKKLDDIIVGPVIFAGSSGDEFCSITDEEYIRIANKLRGGLQI